MADGEIAKLYATIGADASGLVKEVGKADRELKGLAQHSAGFGALMQGALGRAFAGASLAGIAAGTIALAEHGMEMERLANGYDELSRRAGASGDAMLAAMRRASAGTISDADLMLAANKSMMLGVADNAEELGQLLEVARARGKKLGLSSQQAFSDIVTGIGRMSPLILDNLGITVDMAKVTADYAETLGKTSDELTEAEKKQALLNAVLEDTPAAVQAAADSMDELERFNATMANLKAEAGQAIAPEGGRFFGFLADGIDDLKQATADYVEWNRGMRLDFLERGAAEAEARIAELRGEIERTGDPTGRLAQQVAEAEGRLSDFEARANVTKMQLGYFAVSEEDAMLAAGGFGGALATATPAVTGIGEAADESAGKIDNLATAMLGFVQGAYGKPKGITSLSGLFDFVNWGVKAGEEADLQHRLAVLQNVAENADVWRKKGKQDSEGFASDWESAADRMQRAIEDAFRGTADAAARFVDDARGASTRLFDLGTANAMAPGANGPFEDLFRATDVAAHGGASQWAAALGLDQESAKRIVADFQAGLMSPEVIGLIDSAALIDHIRRQQEAERSQQAYAESVAAQAGVDVSAVMDALGLDPGGTAAEKLAEGLRNGLIAANPGADILATINSDIADRKEEFAAAGGAAADMLLLGMINNSNKGILNSFAMALVPMILAAIKDKERRTGGA